VKKQWSKRRNKWWQTFVRRTIEEGELRAGHYVRGQCSEKNLREKKEFTASEDKRKTTTWAAK